MPYEVVSTLIRKTKELRASDDTTQAQVEATINNLNRYQTTLADLDDNILNELQTTIVDDDEVSNDIISSCNIQDEIVEAKAMLTCLKCELTQAYANDDSGVLDNNSLSVSGFRQDHKPKPKLPKLELPKFTGDPLQWTSFHDAYESAIHNNESLSHVDKFNYLRSLLKGLAADSIQGIAVTNANYNSAIDILKERFGQRQIIVSAHIEAIMKIPEASSNVGSLRKMYDSCEVHIRGVDALGITSDTYGVIMAPMIISKLPPDTRLILARNNGADIWDLSKLRKMSKAELEARELSEKQSHKPSQNRPEATRNDYKPTTNALIAPVKSQFRLCSFCNKPHAAVHCNIFSNTEERLRKAKQDKKCFNCLKVGHSVSKCNSQRRCLICERKHHTALCKNTEDAKQVAQSSGDSSNQQRSFNQNNNVQGQNKSKPTLSVAIAEKSEREGNERNSTTIQSPTLSLQSTPYDSPKYTVFMQTAVAYIENPRTHESLKVRILFDQGSHRTFIREDVYKKINLSPNYSEVLSIAPFGQKKGVPRNYVNTEVNIICNNNDRQLISAVVVPVITCPLYHTPISAEVLKTLEHLQLADPPSMANESTEVSILIGLDIYWQLVYGDMVRTASGPTAVSSCLGWLVSGAETTTNSIEKQN